MSVVDQIISPAEHEFDKRGELPLGVRDRLLTQILLHLSSAQQRVSFIGQLGLNCAEKSWPVWLDKFPGDTEPIEFAQQAVAVASDGSAVPGGNARLGELKTGIINKFELGDEYFPAVYAGFACSKVIADMIDHRHEYAFLGESEKNTYIDDWDASFLASIAVAGGATWEDVGDDEARREFWSWYLHQAVPDAFSRISGKGGHIESVLVEYRSGVRVIPQNTF